MAQVEETSPTDVVKRPKLDEQLRDEVQEADLDNATAEYLSNGDSADIDRTNDFPCSELVLHCQGAEARLYRATYLGKPVIVKERFAKTYRHPVLDEQLRREHLKSEIRAMARCRQAGIAVPPLYFVDPVKNRLVLGFIEDAMTVREYVCRIQAQSLHAEERLRLLMPLADEIGRLIAVLHAQDVIHGDLTTSNMLIRLSPEAGDNQECRLILIDFGLSYIERLAEDKGVDLYVLEKAFLSTHPDTESVFERILASYGSNYKNGGKKALDKLAEVRLRGRKREMIG